MLLWMSRPCEALLSGLSGGAQHAGYGGPGGVVLPGADHGVSLPQNRGDMRYEE